MTTIGTVYEAPTTGIWAEYDKAVAKVGEWLHGRRYWTVETSEGWVGVVDGRGVTEPQVSSALAQALAVRAIGTMRSAPGAAVLPPNVVSIHRARARASRAVPAMSRPGIRMRTCAYCGRRVGARSMCCGDFA